jgi:hypothetical protein
MSQDKENIEIHHIPKWLSWAISEEKGCQPTIAGHIALSFSLIALAFFWWLVIFTFGSLWEKEWGYIPEKATVEKLEFADAIRLAKPNEKNRLLEQLKQIEILSEKHAKIMIFFYKQYYISLSMMVSCTAIAVLSLFFISKSGWEKANNAIINVFIVASGVLIFYGNISLAFQQKDNLEASQAIYLNYLALRNEFLSYLATGQTVSANKLAPSDFIHYIDKQMQTVSFIRLGFDPKAIPDLSKQINGSNKQESK